MTRSSSALIPDAALVALDDALNAFAEVDPRKSQVVELRFFGGLTVEGTAEMLGVARHGGGTKLAAVYKKNLVKCRVPRPARRQRPSRARFPMHSLGCAPHAVMKSV
jgi:hypothetical protein